MSSLLEVIFEFVADVFFIGIFYWPGWLCLRMLTMGHYPPKRQEPHNQEFVALIGFLSLVLPVIFYLA